LNAVFSALADPTRRAILGMLAKGDLSAGQIADSFEMAKPSVSHHLSALKAADLVEVRRQGQSLVYSINTTVLEDALAAFLNVVGLGRVGPAAEIPEESHGSP